LDEFELPLDIAVETEKHQTVLSIACARLWASSFERR
jgi:hypothetical protein